MWHTRTYSHSSIDVCDRFLERTKLSRSGARPGRELFIWLGHMVGTHRPGLGLGTHGGANGLVPLLPVSLCEPDKAIRIALDERHAEKCAMRKTLSGGFGTESLQQTTLFFVWSCQSIAVFFVVYHHDKNNLTLKILSRAIKIAKVTCSL